eukprot:NODE_1419_length_544_cov_17.816162_g1342_i0.p3 GENE.NODE_1419_length_544_cov_17.816162_g1342_i0~~NODE_1419_length_544_cov_17.816162_g1342_i0.p3  ORF type:complete len:68 (-),score=5.49 NODE_1419_length_544_cov_17.816162_g1342_i0:132-335(-)
MLYQYVGVAWSMWTHHLPRVGVCPLSHTPLPHSQAQAILRIKVQKQLNVKNKSLLWQGGGNLRDFFF